MFSGSSPRACGGRRGAWKLPCLSAHSHPAPGAPIVAYYLSLTLSSLVVPSRQGSTRKKLAAASGAILEYVGPVAIMAGNRDERQRCWDYLNWLLKQRRGPLSVSPRVATTSPS